MTAPRKSFVWSDYASPAFRDIDPVKTIAILPIAATEQHGPHLPLCTDSAINRGHLDALIAAAPGNLDFRILPVQEIGKSNEHQRMPGTLTIPAGVLIDLWTEIGLSVARAGVRKLVFVNSHGGNEEVMGIVARELRVRASMLVVKSGWMRFGKPEGIFSDRESRFGIHGGDVETSLMLHFRPNLVDMAEARDFASVAEQDEKRYTHLRPTGTLAYAWIADDLNPDGAVGEAHLATAEKGSRQCAHAVAGFIDMLREVASAPLPD